MKLANHQLGCEINPILAAIGTEVVLQEESTILFFDVSLNSTNQDILLVSPWIVYVVIGVLVSLAMMASSIRLVRRPDK